MIWLVHPLKKSVIAKQNFHLLKQSPSKNLQRRLPRRASSAMTRCLSTVIAIDRLFPLRWLASAGHRRAFTFLLDQKSNKKPSFSASS